MSEQQDEARPTPGAGANKHVPAKRVKQQYRKSYLVLNPDYNADQPHGPGNFRRLTRAGAPTFKEFLRSSSDDDVKSYVASKSLARESGTAFRVRKKLPPKPRWEKKKAAASGKKGK